MNKYCYLSFLENTPGEDLFWIIGDNFFARTFRNHYKKYTPSTGDDSMFIKANFEYVAFYNSRFSSSQENMLARLQNSLAMEINAAKRTGWLPKYILVVLDDDLISYLDFKKEGTATLLGTWVEWLANQYDDLVNQRLKQVPKKAKKVVPFFYWVTAPTHQYFSSVTNRSRIKFNLSLESVIRTKENMRVIRIKDGWDTKDSKLVINDRISEQGLTTYWCAIDASVKYNILRREIYQAKVTTQQSSEDQVYADHLHSGGHTMGNDSKRYFHDAERKAFRERPRSSECDFDPMRSFFRRHTDSCRYHGEHRMDVHEDQRALEQHDVRFRDNDQYLLPRPKNYRY